MIGSDLEGADLESRVASRAASATSDDAAAVRAVIQTKPGDDHDPRYRRDATSASPAADRSGTHGGH